MTTAERAIDFQLGPLAPTHRSALEEIVRATGAFRDAEIDVALEVFDDAMVEGQDDYIMLGAFDRNARLVGYACYGATPCTVATWDLYWIAVHPDAQQSGIGTLLLNAVERDLQEKRAALLVIETSSKGNYAATRAFYAARGYADVARVPNFYDEGDDRVIYTKRLVATTESRR